jgi:hypothetical protein
MSPNPTTDAFDRLLDHLSAELDFESSYYNESYLDRRISARMRRRDVDDYDDYLDLVRSDPEEPQALLDSLSINVTSFYRNPEAWEPIREVRREVTAGRGSTTMALADLTGNEALDLYVSNYKRRPVEDSLPPGEIAWEEVVRQVGDDSYEIVPRFRDEYEVRRIGSKVLRLELGEADRVYFNDSTGQFTEQDWREVFQGGAERATEPPRDWGLVARLEDLNGDGVPDLYVCNDYESPDYYYLGREDSSIFRKAPERNLRTTSSSSMSILLR